MEAGETGVLQGLVDALARLDVGVDALVARLWLYILKYLAAEGDRRDRENPREAVRKGKILVDGVGAVGRRGKVLTPTTRSHSSGTSWQLPLPLTLRLAALPWSDAPPR